jgi:hypothetical protein
MIRRTLLGAAVLVVAFATPVAAQPYDVDVTVDAAEVTEVDSISVTAEGIPGSVVTFSIGGAVAGEVIAGEDGVAAVEIPVPDVPPGAVAVEAVSVPEPEARAEVAVAGVTVTTAHVAALPVSGSETALPLSILAVFLLGGGGIAVLAGRRYAAASRS